MHTLRSIQMRVITRCHRSRQVRVRTRLIHLTNFQVRHMVRMQSTNGRTSTTSPFSRHFHIKRINTFMHLRSSTVLISVQPTCRQGQRIPISTRHHSVSQPLHQNRQYRTFMNFSNFTVLRRRLMHTSHEQVACRRSSTYNRSIRAIHQHSIQLIMPLTRPSRHNFTVPRTT